MGSPDIPPEHVYCIQAGKQHYDLFTTIYIGANYCGRCGLANPFRSQRRASSKTPALPGPYDEVVEVEDSPPRPASPASRLLRDRPKPVSSIGIGCAQLLPSEVSATGAVNTRARIPPSEASSDHRFMDVASAASRAIQNSKGSTRKPAKQRTGYHWVHVSLLLVSLEAKYFNGLAVEVPETVLPLKDTVIKFSTADLLTWPSFTETLFDHLRPLPPTIDPTNKDLWTVSYASNFSGKKIVTVSNTDKYTTPSSMLTSGHFSNNQAGQLKVLVVLTSTEVVDKQEPVTPLRPDEYSTPVKEDKKRKVKQEGTSPSSGRKKRVKQEAQIKEEADTTEMGQVKQEIHVKIKKEESLPTSYSQSSTRDEPEDVIKEIVGHGGVVDLSEVDDPLCDLVFDNMPDARRSEGGSDQENEVDEEDCEEDTRFVPEFIDLEIQLRTAQEIHAVPP
ncbi:hypothetical protein EDB81DRAFT_920613 [Dactylonectria macrodidyma]|uniref:Uncharacterized protein n=1 Tax=Dactylonectria macrodidyma TaxID=307937 RepID=A0A9P9D982_9HYPO|nr:hypothetical protein EDB81DRAFT_920613 [Dactylonectria macrodidyma]